MTNKIVGGIGIVWGGFILLNWLMGKTAASGSAAYQNGHTAAVVFGLLLFFVGQYYFFRKPNQAQ